MNKKSLLFWSLFIVMLVLDQVVKAWVRHEIPPQGSLAGKPWPGVFELTLVYNQGIAFGMFQGKGFMLAPIAIAIAAGAIWYSYKHPKESTWTHVSMSLLAAGALGNLYDRMVNHQVTDMFSFRLINFPVFNVADSCITIATILLILSWWIEAAKQKPTQPLTPSG